MLRAGDDFIDNLEVDPPSPITEDMTEDFSLAWAEIAKAACDRFALVVSRRLEAERTGTVRDVLE